jgi:hypothetical protein
MGKLEGDFDEIELSKVAAQSVFTLAQNRKSGVN